MPKKSSASEVEQVASDSDFEIPNDQLMGDVESPAPAAIPLVDVQLSVPMTAEVPEGYRGQHVDLRLTPEQSRKLHRLRAALRMQHAKLRSMRFVNSNSDAILWLIDQLPEVEIDPV